jgi:two-component system, response regulator PdtaR
MEVYQMSNNHYDFCIGSANPTLQKAVSSMLREAGFHSSGERKNMPDFLRLLRSIQPWLAIIDTQLPPGNIKQLATIIEEDGLAAALYLNTDKTTFNDCMIMKWPAEKAVLTAVAKALCVEFTKKQNLRHKIKTLEDKLSRRVEVEKAKGIIMEQMSLDEEKAYRYLQIKSMEKRITMLEMATMIIAKKDLASY